MHAMLCYAMLWDAKEISMALALGELMQRPGVWRFLSGTHLQGEPQAQLMASSEAQQHVGPLRALLVPSTRHQITQEFATAGVVVLLVHVDQQFDGLVADRLLQGICDEDPLEGLQE